MAWGGRTACVPHGATPDGPIPAHQKDLENPPFVVLGATLKNELFGADNALGQRVRIGAAQFR